ncbi:MAG: hypothetical protein EFT35_10500 [Methanophagales archaeon ANME-1-THS]|nr:MAG: hypothetical protein EFT35_10500 [Methanophagales archaeon ANME-1-THS]
MQFSVPGDDVWREGKLVLEDGILYFCSKEESKHFFNRILLLRKGEKIHNIVPLGSIRDVVRGKQDRLSIKYRGTAQSPAPEQLLSTTLVAAEDVLNDVERELVLRMDATTFTIYIMGTSDLRTKKDVELEKGLLKIASEALWIIGRGSLKRIAGDDIVDVEQKKRGVYQGTEYGAIAIEYLSEGSAYTKALSDTIITKGTSIEAVLRALLDLKNAYTPHEKLSELENRIVTMMYAGVLDLAPSAPVSAAQALGVREEELTNQLKHLNELGLIDLANERLLKNGLKFAIPLSKQSTTGG